MRATCPTSHILDVFILILLSGSASNEAHLSGFSSLRLPPPSWGRIPSSSCFRPRVTYGLALYQCHSRLCKPIVMVAIIYCCNRQELCILPLGYIYVFFLSFRNKQCFTTCVHSINPYPTAFPYGNGMVLHFYQQQESSTTKTVHKVINKGLKTYV